MVYLVRWFSIASDYIFLMSSSPIRCRKVCPGWYRLGLPHISRVFAYVCYLFGGCYMAESKPGTPGAGHHKVDGLDGSGCLFPQMWGIIGFAVLPNILQFSYLFGDRYVTRPSCLEDNLSPTAPRLNCPTNWHANAAFTASFPVHWLVMNGIPRSWIII